MSFRWRWLFALDSWDTPLERYGASWDKYIVLSYKGDTDCWLLGTSKKQPRSSNYYKEITCVEFYFCQVNARPEVAVIYSPGWCASQILPSSCCHSFSSTQFYWVLQRRERSQSTPQSCSEPFLPCFLLYQHLYSSLYKSFHFLQQPDSISDLFSVNYCRVIFQLFSYHNFLLLNSLNVLSTVNEKTPSNC